MTRPPQHRRPPPARPANADPARDEAWRLVASFLAGRNTRVIDDLRDDGDSRDLALARELALGAVRWQRLYDALCTPFLRTGDQPIALRIALRLLCHQLLVCDRIPAHAAVHATIDTAKANGAGHLSGVINAVGRRIAELADRERHGDGPLGRIPEASWPRRLGERHSLPDLLIDDLAAAGWGGGKDGPDAALMALNQVPPLCTRTRPGRVLPHHQAMIRSEGPWTWWSDPAIALRGPVADGLCVVQDHSQGEVAAAARPRTGDLVLDVCAAPGGKALAFADHGCRVVAGEVNPGKMALLRRNLQGSARVIAQDGRQPAFAPGSFDLVLVDAPCSNTGVLGRRPEARWRYTRPDLLSLETLQRNLLAASAPLVAPGGRLVYSTCSVSPRENQLIAQALSGWRVLAERLTWPDAWQAGGYVAVLVRH